VSSCRATNANPGPTVYETAPGAPKLFAIQGGGTATGPRELAERMLAALAERDGIEVERLALRLASAVLDAESYSGHDARAGGER